MAGAGETKIDTQAIMAKAMRNRDALDNCPRHRFPPLALEDVRLGAKIECVRCKGRMDLVNLNFYVRGYEAAGRNGNDILPGWKDSADDGTPARRHFGDPAE